MSNSSQIHIAKFWLLASSQGIVIGKIIISLKCYKTTCTTLSKDVSTGLLPMAHPLHTDDYVRTHTDAGLTGSQLDKVGGGITMLEV